MSFITISRAFGQIGLALTLSLLLLAGALLAPQLAAAQTEPNQSYDCGAYGAGNYGQNDCVAATETTPTPTPTSSSTPTPTSAADGLSPDTGAGLGMWAALGALITACGLALYGYNRRQQRINRGTR